MRLKMYESLEHQRLKEIAIEILRNREDTIDIKKEYHFIERNYLFDVVGITKESKLIVYECGGFRLKWTTTKEND